MADSNLRTSRDRDAAARYDADRSPRGAASDPLAELARLIGQSNPAERFDAGAGHDPADMMDAGVPAAGLDWAANDGFAEQEAPPERYQPPHPAYPPRDPGYGYADDEPSPTPAGFDGLREDPRDFPPMADMRHRAEADAPNPFDRPPPPLPSELGRDGSDAESERYEPDREHRDDDHGYRSDDYDEEPAPSRRRGGVVLVMAVLGLAVLGTAGAFGYRAVFGAAVVRALPPIIKAGDGPNKIIPASAAEAQNTTRSVAKAPGSPEKLVSQEEQPVDIPQPATSPTPRVVATIPVAPATTATTPSTPTQPPFPPPPALLAPPAPAAQVAAPLTPPSPATGPEPKRIHTVTIRPDQLGNNGTFAAQPPVQRQSTQPASRSIAVQPQNGQNGSNGPLALVPNAQADTPARARAVTARAPAAAPVATSSVASAGGFAVQVTSQRSEAEAQSAYKSLRTKFPNQLGGREPIIRRAELGGKGTFFRALVGPFASAEEAAAVCSGMKAAGGTCIVQRN